MGLLHSTATGAALQRVPKGLAVSGPVLHKALTWRYGGHAARLGCSSAGAPRPLPARRGGASTPQTSTTGPQRRALLVEGWDEVAQESGGHWVGVTHHGTILCLFRGNRPLAMPLELYVAAGAVLALISKVYAVWYVVLPAPGAPPRPLQHQYPRAGEDATARAWLAARKLVWAWPKHRKVHAVLHAP